LSARARRPPARSGPANRWAAARRRRRAALAAGLLAPIAGALTALGVARAAPPGGCPEPAEHADIDGGCVPSTPPNASLVPDLSVLKTPDAPAFAALGVSPTFIERPSTPAGAAVDLVTGIAGQFLKPGDSIAVQYSPFWSGTHPELSARDVEEQPGRAFIRDFTLSFATTQSTVDRALPTGTVTPTAVNRAALGARTTIWPGTPSVEAQACRRMVDAYLLRDATLKADIFAAEQATWRSTHPRPVPPSSPRTLKEPDPASFHDADELAKARRAYADWTAYREATEIWTAQLQAVLDAKNAALFQAGYAKAHPLTDEVQRCFTVMHHRTGFLWDGAVAVIGDVPSADPNHPRNGGGASITAWSTGALVASRGRISDPRHRTPYDFSVVGVARFHYDDVFGPYLDRKQLDYGARLVLALERWGFSIEGLGRYDRDLPLLDLSRLPRCHCTYRVGGVVDYRLHSGMWATLSGGTDFRDLDGRTPFRLLAHFQANFGLQRMLTPDTTTTTTTNGAPGSAAPP
jgi:hypothetical protein